MPPPSSPPGPSPDPAPDGAGGGSTALLPRELAAAMVDDPSGRLAAYLARTQQPLDLLALLTMWIVAIPIFDISDERGLRGFALTFRLLLSAVYGVDMAIRATLARRHLRYLRAHLVGIAAVILPPIRVLFSLRLMRVLFQRGNLPRLLFAALVLLLNGALIVFFFERHTPGANIVTLRDSIWWSIVTVSTVGYGDYYPVTLAGQIVATLIMAIGIITVAVVTAQVASTFVDQASRARAARADRAVTADGEPASTAIAATVGPTELGEPAAEGPTLAELDARLARIEALLVSLAPGDGPPDAPA